MCSNIISMCVYVVIICIRICSNNIIMYVACKNVPAHVGNHNWKTMLVAEVSPAPVSVSLDVDRTPKLLFFELTCRLLYQEEPNELVSIYLLEVYKETAFE